MMVKKLLSNHLSNNLLPGILVVLTIGFLGCANQRVTTSFTQPSTKIQENLPRVVATTTILCDLTRQVAQNTINLTCLGSPDNDSYFYQPRSGHREAIAQADLVFHTGYNFKSELLKTLAEGKTSTPKVAVNELAVPQPQQFLASGERLANPHVWHDVKNTIRMVEIISHNLKIINPDYTTFYSDNARLIQNELTQLDTWIKSRIDTIPKDKRKLLATSNVMNYYTTAYKIPLVKGLENISSIVNPTDAQVKTWVTTIQQAQVPTIFPDTTINQQFIASVPTPANVRVSQRQLYTYGLGEPGGEADNYQKLMVANTRTIVEGLGGTYLIFPPRFPAI
ncbi:zinc ABC transporter substrate-binding protein [Anabaenopsis tanganyikae CS-531]|uniref:Zinc ABC transporter substrate-binding protein n=2 Tax=Anabaenopsis TaxID=110103 RepID=A0ABT6KHV3_9CYAN|nr:MULTISPECIES: zinc ABC transporter substrate-binding protein [Anabaenopsis]MDB9538818.1 zinc ABC transporter substrate-binding protein [Anabaenopsis arnoldii]MDH6091095.1 zinc ABC transporter substrate-binding protein [Anabaenopsis arnoldii]MDH6107425.1 zinc ABC transporter substrate-binding protein [Anabaenopsis tanganyikae CS-531]